MNIQQCGACGGSGYYVTPVCCRNFTKSGGCCNCPEPNREPCEYCQGSGYIDYGEMERTDEESREHLSAKTNDTDLPF